MSRIDQRFCRAFLSPFIAVLALAVAAPAHGAVIVAAGDIACGPTATSGDPAKCQDAATAGIVEDLAPDAVLALGDLQYEVGDYAAFGGYYDKTWGRFKSITRPVPGNHEYRTPGAQGYFDYFNGVGAATGRAGARDRGYYSFNLGAWHIVALNSNCGADTSGGCGPGSPQEQWLRRDLAANSSPCTLAFWHHPRWSSDATHQGYTDVAPLVQALHDDRADVLLVGHSHIYERFAPQTPEGVMDGATGIAQFTVGTGGRSEYSFGTFQANSLVRGVGYGVLRLGLHGDYYDWRFVGTPETEIADQGAKLCHRAPRPASRVLRIPATADTTVRSDAPAATAGAEKQLGARARPDARSYLKFDVTGLDGGRIKSAWLAMWVTDASPGSGAVHRISSTTWSERSLTWSTRPSLGGSLGSVGPVTAGRWVNFNVTPAVTGEGPVSFALSSAQTDAVGYAAREGGAAYAPRLRINVESGDVTPPTTPVGLTAMSTTSTSVGLGWKASTDATGVAGYRVTRDGKPLTTTSTTTFTDTSTEPATTYRYRVSAHDAAGNESPPSAELAVTTPDAVVTSFSPTDDTFVDALTPTTAYGSDHRAS